MKVFLVGITENVSLKPTAINAYHERWVPEFKRLGHRATRELTSYERLRDVKLWERYMETVPTRCEFFLDSGAYTARTQGITINLDEYAQFVLDRPGVFQIVCNLDVIPGTGKGSTPTRAEFDKAAAGGWENYLTLKKKFAAMQDLTLLHVYHAGEDLKWLKKIMDHCEYFGISRGGLSPTEGMSWFDDAMNLICDKNGKPLRKVHGFGITALDLLYRYPWYSVDSTSWVLTSRFGGIFLTLNGQQHKVVFSSRSPSQGEEGKHFLTYTKPEQTAIRAYLDAKGFTPEQVADDYLIRDILNIDFFLDLERTWVDRPFDRSKVAPRFF